MEVLQEGYRIPFRGGPHFIQGTHPLYGLLSSYHPGQSLDAGGGVSAPEGSHRVGSAFFAGLLQPLICSHEGLGVVAASNRSFTVESQGTQNTIQDGDSPICSVVSSQWRLDGLHRSKGCISSSSNASGIQKVPSVHGIRQSLPIQGSLLTYLRNQGGTRSAVLNQTAQDLLRWVELHSISLLSQFIMGHNNVWADSLSRPHQVLGSEWAVKLCVFQQLWRKWPVSIDLFTTSLNHCCLPYFSLFRSSPTVGWVAGVCLSSLCAYSCYSEKVLLVLRGPADNHSSLLAPEALVSRASGACNGRSGGSAAFLKEK